MIFQSRARPGFTLIEMMVVITIIVILAGLTVAGLGYVNTKKANAKAKVDIQLLSQALERYKFDNGNYPGDGKLSSTGDNSQYLYNALFYDGYQSQASNKTGADKTEIYLPQLDPRDSKQNWVKHTASDTPSSDQYIIDPWQHHYYYLTGDQAHNPDFDLWSLGKDGKQDTGDDIRNY